MTAGKDDFRPHFGAAGLAQSFYAQGFKKMPQMPAYYAPTGLDAFEYQCGHGVRLKEESANALRADGDATGRLYSLHAPYYISLSSLNEETRLKSLVYLRQSAEAVRALGGRRVILHSGTAGKQPRAEALALAQDTLARARQMLDDEGFEDILLCPETMGKLNQLGDLAEVLALCAADERHIPCIDFGHLNARTQGSLKTRADFAAVVDAIGEALGEKRARTFHVHFSKIEYTAAGEKRHLTFEDTEYGPPFEPFLQLCAERGLGPTIICESSGTQTEDAQAMMRYFAQLA